MEWRYQYALAYIKRGSELEKELLNRKTVNDKLWNDLKESLPHNRKEEKSNEDFVSVPSKKEIEGEIQ